MKFSIEMKRKFENTESPLKATANLVIDDCFVIHEIKLIDAGKGMFMSMPSFRGREERWVSICHPIKDECRKEIQNALIEAYKQEQEE